MCAYAHACEEIMTIGKRRGLIFAITFVLLAFFASAVGLTAQKTSYANGETVIYVNTENDLVDLSDSVNAGNSRLGEKFVFNKDLDLSTEKYAKMFNPIGKSVSFHGIIDGNGHSVKLALTAEGNSPSAFIGKLGTSGVVTGLTVTGSIKGSARVAGIAAENEGNISECVVSATITNDGTNNASSVTGGITAYSDGVISSCVSISDITAPANAGGIAGTCGGSINDSVFLGKLYANGTAAMKIGGLVGVLAGSMTSCYTRSSVSVAIPDNADKSSIGSVVGAMGGSKTERNYAVADEFSFPAGGGKDEIGKYERKSLYEFLSEDRVGLSDAYVRADYEVGTGFLYAPSFLIDVSDGKAKFISENVKKAFGASLFTSGDGTQENPWVIGEEKQWAVSGADCWKLFKTNASMFDYDGKYVVCTGDVNVGESHSISTSDAPFSGYFDGGNKTFTLNGNGNADNVALFSFVGGNAVIKDFTLKGKSISGRASVAAAIANASGNASISGITNYCPTVGETFVGGIVGQVASDAVKISDCKNYAMISGTGGNGTGKIGGVIGYVKQGAEMKGLVNYGEITVSNGGTSDVGGVIGGIDEVDNEVSALHNEGKITAAKSYNVGGVIGSIIAVRDKEITNLSAVCSITGKQYVGGIVGKASGEKTTAMRYLASLAEVKGENYVSGIANANGAVAMTIGYFTGTITEIKGSGTATFVCDPIAVFSDGSFVATDKIYYNGDDGNGYTKTTATVKNTIQLTDGKTFEETGMEERQPTITYGTFPFPKSNRADLTREERLNAVYFDGTENDGNVTVYLIASEKAMRNLSFFTRTGTGEYATQRYKLASDITMTREFAPIKDFGGIFDGNGKTITALTITDDGEFVGLFDVLKQNATVKTLMLTSGTITATDVGATVGAVCGKAENGATVLSVAADITVQGEAKTIGGLVGSGVENNVKNSFFAGKIVSEGNATAGGVTGESVKTNVTDCFFLGKIANCSLSGGIVGNATDTIIDACYASGRIEGEKTGGIAGKINGGSIQRALVIADIVYDDIKDKGAIYGVSETKPEITDCFYNKDYIKLGAYNNVDEESNKKYAKTTDFFTINGPGNLNVDGYTAMNVDLNADCDAYFTQYLTVYEDFVTGSAGETVYAKKIGYYVRKSVEIAIFGRDTSSDEPAGTEGNPYIVDTAQRFAKISELAIRTDFADKYFVVPCDIDMSQATSMRAIGYYSLLKENPFGGTIYGKKADGTRPVIKNVKITQATDGTASTTEYLGVFACTSESFVIKDLILDGSVSGSTEVAGVVGYMHKGRIENVWSKINVTASGEKASGMVSAVSASATIKGSVCSGTVTASENEYGIVGVAKTGAGVAVDATASWFVIKGEKQGEYTHNNIGSVLFDYSDETKMEKLEITDGKEDGFGFKPTYNAGGRYKGKILNATDAVIYSSDNVNAYYDNINEDITRTFSVRYCSNIEVSVECDDGAAGNIYATAKANDEYYIGQTVTISIEFTDEGRAIGTKFVGLIDKNKVGYEYELVPSAGEVRVAFVMSENTEKITLKIDKISSGEEKILTFGRSDGTTFDDGKCVYDGKTVDVSYANGLNGSIELYVSGELKETIFGAGEYLVIARITDENNSFIGLYETIFTMEKRTLELSSDESKFAIYLTTVYERGKDERTVTFVVGDDCAVSGAAEKENGDKETPSVTLTFKFGQENAGENVNVRIIDATTDDNNYEFKVKEKEFGNVGTIQKKTIKVVATDADENGVIETRYCASKPEINAGTYEIGIEWTLAKDGTTATAFNVGTYTASVYPKNDEDGHNYSVVTDKTYTVAIKPYVISKDALRYGKTEIEYNGKDVAKTIENDAFFTVPFDSLNHSMTLAFYIDKDGTTQAETVINAGNYYVKGNSDDKNYEIDEKGELTVITVNKKNAGALNVSFKRENGNKINQNDTVIVEDFIYIDVSSDQYANDDGFDGRFVVEESGFKTVNIDGKWYVVPVNGGTTLSFTVKTKFATNFTDRSAETFTVNVEKKKIYAILNNDTFVFGDRIIDALYEGLEYYYIDKKNGINTVGAKIDAKDISGLDAPSISLGSSVINVGTYENITFSGGDSEGYSFEYYTATKRNEHEQIVVNEEKKIFVMPRPITLVVKTAVGKIYGEGKDKENVPYIVTAVENGETVVLDVLPDGNAVTIKGLLGRESGESVGEYALNVGTITKEDNPNYIINTNFTSKFTISKRHVKIEVIAGQGKEYGEKDGEIEFKLSDEDDNELVNSTELGINDTMDIFKPAIRCVRQEGENVGFYAYSLVTYEDKLRALDYEVDVADISELSYEIRQTTPVVYFEVEGFPKYGDKVDEIAYRLEAKDKYGKEIEGKISVYVFDIKAAGMRRDYVLLQDEWLYAEFIPEETNYKTITKNAEITVGKRKTGIKLYYKNDGGLVVADNLKVPYKGASYSEKDFMAEITDAVNLADNEVYTITLDIKGDVKNVTKDGFYITASVKSDYYELTGKSEFKVTINKGLITVNVENAVINEGDKYSPELSYDGFVGTDKTSAISKLPTVKNIPEKAGYYSIKAEGGAATNYDFFYVEGVLTINAKSAASTGGKIEGTLPPTYEITFTSLDGKGSAFAETAKNTDKILGNKFYAPLSVAMREYVEVKGNNALSGETYEYAIKFDDMTENSKIYVRLTSGEIKRIEFTVEENGDEKYAVFTEKEITAAMRYETKTVQEMLVGYAGIAIIAAVAILIIAIAVAVGASQRKKKNKRNYYAVKSRWK